MSLFGIREHWRQALLAFGAGAIGTLAQRWLWLPLLTDWLGEPLGLTAELLAFFWFVLIALIAYGVGLRVLELPAWNPFERWDPGE